MSASNGDRTLRCHMPGCRHPLLIGGEREDGSNPDPMKGRGHAVDAEGRAYHYRCYFRRLRETAARPMA